ncbi:hypothetical protein GCM10010289_15620 [Streptomyces violascens]|uniref:Peptidase S33 tripeptidyl aminopeptidase-like C-terminal domain-containing protein n=1 Tax=Streptomyces violascens TaxID=67381 RepID=A0ABQ3QJD8_9ACTN|nr:hypothetical protein GCM10010289_15620 [Streptomyces violascens]GHI37390.1 hypothetical protein Sviol_17980 [Streptomyces violascens]
MVRTRHPGERALPGVYVAGGRVREIAVPGAGHAVPAERSEECGAALLETLSEGARN